MDQKAESQVPRSDAYQGQCFCFQNSIIEFFGCVDPENMQDVDLRYPAWNQNKENWNSGADQSHEPEGSVAKKVAGL